MVSRFSMKAVAIILHVCIAVLKDGPRIFLGKNGPRSRARIYGEEVAMKGDSDVIYK
jgi:hypothetical protein